MYAVAFFSIAIQFSVVLLRFDSSDLALNKLAFLTNNNINYNGFKVRFGIERRHWKPRNKNCHVHKMNIVAYRLQSQTSVGIGNMVHFARPKQLLGHRHDDHVASSRK